MKEIGSEFWDVPTGEEENRLFPKTTQWYLSGRSALKAIIRELHGKKSVSLPSWCCDSIIKPFVEAGFQIHFYPVYWKNGLVQEIRNDSDVLFLMNFFGYTASDVKPNEYSGTVIRDATHSLFSASYDDADYCFGSLRKWCGVWTGGFAWTKDGHRLPSESFDDTGYIALREKAMLLKSEYILRENGIQNKEYLSVFESAEELLEHVGIETAAARDIRLAKRMDAARIRALHRANAEVLRQAFQKWLIFREMRDTDCPMFVPILIPDGKRDVLRRFLIENQIYCPVHWPVSSHHKPDSRTKKLYLNELSLVCDQRYTEKDMLRTVKAIREFMEI